MAQQVKASACKDIGDTGSILWVGMVPLGEEWQPSPVGLPGEFHGQREPGWALVQNTKRPDTTEHCAEAPRGARLTHSAWNAFHSHSRTLRATTGFFLASQIKRPPRTHLSAACLAQLRGPSLLKHPVCITQTLVSAGADLFQPDPAA